MAMMSDRDMLVRRMVIRSMMPRDYEHPSEKDIRDNARAVRELVLIGVLDYAMIDLVDSLRRAHAYKFAVKKNVNRLCDIVRSLHDDLYRRVLSVDEAAKRRYSDLRDSNYYSMTDHVLIEDKVVASVSVVCSLCRLILALNDSLRGRYDYKPIEALSHVLREVEGLGYEDKKIDFLIDKSIKA